jgi:hypothetical protein
VFFVLSGAWLGSTARYPLRFHFLFPGRLDKVGLCARQTGRGVKEMWLVSYTKERKEVGGGSTVAVSSQVGGRYSTKLRQRGLAVRPRVRGNEGSWRGRSLWVSGAESFVPWGMELSVPRHGDNAYLNWRK